MGFNFSRKKEALRERKLEGLIKKTLPKVTCELSG